MSAELWKIFSQCSPHFASGMVDGYFDGEVPVEFWQLLALYIASNTLSSLPWAIPFGDGEIETMKNQARRAECNHGEAVHNKEVNNETYSPCGTHPPLVL